MSVVIAVLFGANYAAYHVKPEWRDFMEWLSISIEKRDHGNYCFEWNKEEYLANGFTENDFKLLDFWFFGDTEYFNLDKFRLMKEIGSSTRGDKVRLSPELITEAAKKMIQSNETQPYLALFILLLGLCFIMLRSNVILAFLFNLLIAFGEYYYLICKKRIEWRVECGILLALLIPTVIYAFRKEYLREKTAYIMTAGKDKLLSKIVLVLTCVACIIMMGNNLLNQFVDEKGSTVCGPDDGNYHNIKEISESEGFYVLSVDTAFGGLCGAKNIYSITKTEYEGYYHNMAAIGGSIIPSPIGYFYAHQAGIANPFRALFERNDVYYVGGGERMGYILVFLQEKYNKDITVEYVGTIGDNDVWKFNSPQ